MGGRLYFADSEVSAIRGIDMASEQVFTVIGEGLFSYGDVDGVFPKAKLQHPLGVAAWGTCLVVADTYNHKIKIVDPGSRSARTLLGTGRPGTETVEGELALFEPGGLSVCGDRLFIADTNNHRIVEADLRSGGWREVVFDGLAAPRSEEAPGGRTIAAEPVALAAGAGFELVLDLSLPEGTHLSPEAPWSVRVSANGTTVLQRTGRSDKPPLKVTVPGAGVLPQELQIEAAFAYCTEGNGGLCFPGLVAWHLPIRPGGSGTRATLRAIVDPVVATH
jgi:hypothetical protein